MGRRIVWIAAAVYAAACGIYLLAFHGLPWGGPSSWGTFGDFVGGVVNPALSLLTIYLVIKTFEHEIEAAKTERGDAERRYAVELRMARCDAALRWFDQENRTTVSGRIGMDENNSVLSIDTPTPLSALFADGVLQRRFSTAVANKTFDRVAWSGRFNVCVNALIEVADACAELDQLDDRSTLAASYRRRAGRAACFLSSIGQLPPGNDAIERLAGSPMFLGDIGHTAG